MVSDLKHIVDLAETEFARRDRRSEFVRNPAAWVEYKLGYQLWSKQREMLESLVDNRTTLVAAGHGVSKPLVRTEKVRTTAGWSTIGELKIGDRVYDEQGMPTMVVGKSQVWEQECYEIEFSDGTKIISAKGHEWNVLDLSKRTKKMKSGVSDWREHWDDTKTMQIEDLFAAGVKTQSGQNRWRIPTARPLQTPSVDLPINPYLFGFWIADGSSSGGQITIGAKKAGLLDWLTQNGYEYTSNWNPDRNGYTVGIRGLRTSLRELGVLGDKRVPDAYVWASEHQRREFLAGFLDGDGWITQNSALIQVSQTKKHITDAVEEILLSLGYVTHRTEQVAQYKLDGEYTVTGTAYKVGFTPDVNPFKVRNEGWSRTTQQSRQTQRTIVAIRKVETVPTQCIEVDSKRHLFLAGRNLVPTHNSFTAAMVVCWWMDTHPIQETFVATTAPSASQLNVVWDYVRTFHQQAQARYESGLIDAPLPGYVTGDNKWKVDGVIRGEGRKPPDRPQADAFQGRHAKYLLGLVDEAVGVPEPLINGIFHIATAEYNRVMMIANPTNPSSAMGKLWQKCDNEPAAMKDYHRITISAAMSPLIVPEPGFDMERAKGLSGPQFLVDSLARYGSVDDPRYRARVLGQWSYDEGNTVFTQEELARARDCIVRPYPTQNREIGVDIARMGCFDDTTEVLTDSGWTLFQNLTGDERVMSQNVASGVAEWMPITQVHKYAFDGNLNLFENNAVSFAITDNHRLVTSGMHPGAKYHVREYRDLPTAFKVRRTGTWLGSNPEEVTFTSDVPMPHGGRRVRQWAFDFGDWAEFLGWFVSEGNVYVERREGARMRVQISQNPGAKADRVSALLDRMGIAYKYKTTPSATGGNFEFSIAPIAEWLVEHCGVGAANKRVPAVIRNATPETQDLFLDAYLAGDGTTGTLGQRTYYSSSYALLGDVQAMLAVRGRSGKLVRTARAGSTFQIEGRTATRKHDTYALYEKSRPSDASVSKKNVVPMPYKGFVYCVTTPHGTIMVRRNGRVMWSGNSDSSQVYLKEVGEIWETDEAGKPTKGTGVEGVRLRHVGEWRKAPLVGNNELNPGSAQRVHKIAVEEIIPVVKVDASGIGSGVIDGLAQLNEENDYVVIEVFGGAPATDNRAYRNMRAEQFFEMKTAMLRGELDLDNDDSQLFEELESLLFEYSGDGVIKIESKEDIRKAGRDSPDRADTAWYAFLNVDEILSAEGLAVGDKFTRAADELFPDLALEYGDFGYPM